MTEPRFRQRKYTHRHLIDARISVSNTPITKSFTRDTRKWLAEIIEDANTLIWTERNYIRSVLIDAVRFMSETNPPSAATRVETAEEAYAAAVDYFLESHSV